MADIAWESFSYTKYVLFVVCYVLREKKASQSFISRSAAVHPIVK